MEASVQEEVRRIYKSPRWVQVWFLSRSRRTWKRRHRELKMAEKRLKNEVADVRRSRDKWRREAEEQRERGRELEVENAALRARLEAGAALKKSGRCVG